MIGVKSDLLVHQRLGKQRGQAQGLRRGHLVLVPNAYSTPELFDIYPGLSACPATEGHLNLGFWDERKRLSCAYLEEV